MEMATKKLPDDLSCEPLAYLYGISKNLICQHYRKYGREIPTDFSLDEFDGVNYENSYDEDDEVKRRLNIIIPHMSESCQKLMRAYLLCDDVEEIANSLGYKSQETVHARKNQCLVKLAEIIEKEDPWLAKKLKKQNKKKNNDS